MKDHAVVTNKKGTVKIKPVGEAKLMVNGKKIKTEQELHHNDRFVILVVPNQLIRKTSYQNIMLSKTNQCKRPMITVKLI